MQSLKAHLSSLKWPVVPNSIFDLHSRVLFSMRFIYLMYSLSVPSLYLFQKLLVGVVEVANFDLKFIGLLVVAENLK